MQKCDDVFRLVWRVSSEFTFIAIFRRKAISWRCEALIKLMAGHQDAGGGISRTSSPLVWYLRGGGGGSSTVEPSRWWTYAAPMHGIITFISWRWHVTSSGWRAIMEAGSVAFFLAVVLPKLPRRPTAGWKNYSMSFAMSNLANSRVKNIEHLQ